MADIIRLVGMKRLVEVKWLADNQIAYSVEMNALGKMCGCDDIGQK